MIDFDFKSLFTEELLTKMLKVSITLVVGILLIRIINLILSKVFLKNLSKQSQLIVTRLVTYTCVLFLTFIVFNQLGIKISALLGAAGVLGIVIGIASQTSFGNIVSGIFIISEKTFEIGDVIRIGDKTGTVHSIDLLSVKLRTFDNLLIRIPHQTIISTELTNVTRFPIRRMEFNVSVAYKEDLEKVTSVLKDLAENNPDVLTEPEPLILFRDFGDSGINILFAVWFEKTNFAAVKNSVFKSIKSRFDEEGIEIPFPHVSIYTGSVTEPFPIKVESKNT